MNEDNKNIEDDRDVFGRKRKRKGGKQCKKNTDDKNHEAGNANLEVIDGPSRPRPSQVAEDIGPSPSQMTEDDGPCRKKVKMYPKEEEPKRPTAVSQILRGINVASFAAARAVEISNTLAALKEAAATEGKRVFQRVPRHMRRRAASHNRKRMPSRLQTKAKLEDLKGAPVKKTKMPSRKHRRRPKNLLEEYNRRKKNHAWLETHIWHAKRFKMIEKWGYKLAEQPCNKGFRSTYRASAHGCIMQDISYHGCIEIIGTQEMISECLRHHCSKETGAKFNSSNVLSGKVESSFIFYHYDCYPRKAIGPISLMWKPLMKQDIVVKAKEQIPDSGVIMIDDASERILWIWCHPTCHDELVAELRMTFAKLVEKEKNSNNLVSGKSITDDHSVTLNEQKESQNLKSIADDFSKKPQNPAIVDAKIIPNDDESTRPKIESEKFCIDERILINSYKLDFVRIRLTGPLSHKILASAFKLHEPIKSQGEHWWQKFYDDHNQYHKLNESIKAWKVLEDIQSTAELLPRVILGLTVVDPRLNIPEQKTWPFKEMKEKQNVSADSTEESSQERLALLKDWPSGLSHSPIWNYNIRQAVKDSKLSEADLNRKRSQKLDIGEDLGIDEDSSRIPVLLIQRPGVEDSSSKFSMSHYGSGWDLIVPSGWAMPFWVSLVYRGAHVGGQREERNICLEMKSPSFPREFPDTAAGKIFIEDERKKKKEKYERYPPNKRPNYQKLGVVDPFGFSWQKLVDEWINVHEDILRYLDLFPIVQQSISSSAECKSGENDKNSNTPTRCPIKTQISDAANGFYVLRDLDVLYSIKEILFKKRKKSSRIKSKNRDDVSTELKSLLASLLNKHYNAIIPVSFQCTGKGEVTDDAIIAMPTKRDLEDLSEDLRYGGPTEPLHRGLKAVFPAITDSFNVKRTRVPSTGLCTRWTIGHVTSGRYSLSCGKSSGLGFVGVTGFVTCMLMQMYDCNGFIVLLRNNNSQQYRFARIDLILP